MQSLHYVGVFVQPAPLPQLPLDLSLFFGLPGGGLQGRFRPLSVIPVTGGYNTGPGGFTGSINGTLDGTVDAGTFTGVLTANLANGCVASRNYSGPLTRSSLNWTAGAQVNDCGGSSPLAAPLTPPASAVPPTTVPANLTTTTIRATTSSTTTVPNSTTSVVSTTTSAPATTTTVLSTSTSTTSFGPTTIVTTSIRPTTVSTTVPTTSSTSTSSSTSSSTSTTTIPALIVVQKNDSPNPVPFSGTTINDPRCVGITNTWFYTETLINTGALSVTITHEVDRLDSSVVNDLAQNILIGASQQRAFNFQWCSSNPAQHTLQTTYTIVDSLNRPVTVTGTVTVTLLARPGTGSQLVRPRQ